MLPAPLTVFIADGARNLLVVTTLTLRAQQLSLTNPMHAYHKRSNNQVSLAQLWASRTACISHTRTRAGERARALCERARAFVHMRAHICLSQKLYFEGEDPQQIEQAANMQITSRAQHTT
jgi:hypothetical protein